MSNFVKRDNNKKVAFPPTWLRRERLRHVPGGHGEHLPDGGDRHGALLARAQAAGGASHDVAHALAHHRRVLAAGVRVERAAHVRLVALLARGLQDLVLDRVGRPLPLGHQLQHDHLCGHLSHTARAHRRLQHQAHTHHQSPVRTQANRSRHRKHNRHVARSSTAAAGSARRLQISAAAAHLEDHQNDHHLHHLHA